ncbi:MAG: hypothetical protein UT12_C0008G0011 [Candidatus Curtissbacteria bacterium GW2011_GWC2_38_9]|uniref:Glycosyltransferase RgtA/B/C/D-like domain-containing protein n=2 Tax=Candidatus Curtissiibacteriota TaxID=1752717 RepID=A0A0G0LFC6_9BACT|nr:MAG: hypothetical protein UT12_C0008G0011 [Candidatus Curtissbacteria bacterium GW2011_GWC2_38_9]KKS04137.1 MAG: hypothetical protein UU56_C0009G0019 [Candidatus Curtissbacteria bacterium GW2011_GWA2_41_24]
MDALTSLRYNQAVQIRKFLKSNWPIIIILIIAAILRFWRLEALTTFGGDQGYDLENIRPILKGNLTLLGPRIGPYNGLSTLYLGPFYYYLLAPFIWLTKLDPIGASYATVLARLVTIFLIYLVTKKIFSVNAAIISGVIATLSPYWVNYLGFPSNPYFILPITSLIIFLLTVKKKNSPIIFAIFGLLTGFAFHLHYLGLIILPAFLIYLLNNRELLKMRYILSLLLGIAFAISPIILFESRNDFFLTSQFLKQLNTTPFNLTIVNFIEKLILSVRFMSIDTIGFSSLILIFSVMFILIIFKIMKQASAEQKIIINFLVSILVINVVFASLYSGQLMPHYLAVSYPSIFILAGVVIYFTKKINKAFPLLILIIISIFLFQKNDFFSSSGYTMPEDLTLKEIRNISQIIASDIQNESFNITSTLDGDSRAMTYRYLTSIYGKKPEGIEHYDYPQNLYVITRDPARVVRQNSLFEIASFQPSFVKGIWNMNGDIKLIRLSKQKPEEPRLPKFITIVNPVRPRYLWNNQSAKVISSQLKQITDRNLNATWLLSYESLFDQELLGLLNGQKDQEIGAFLEVSEKWATDARVLYKVAIGDYYRPDKLFLSGYTPQDRQKLIKTYFDKFHTIFGKDPQSVGGWYIDANSQVYLSKLGVKSALTVADQYDTDAASVWGKYWGMPFYPSKLNTLEPAINQSNKIPIVNIQWAQRDPVLGYGKEIKDSRQSFQANDYISNGYNTNYFVTLLDDYLANSKNNDFIQITIGLEAGQEAQRFSEEFAKQLDILEAMQKSEGLAIVTMSNFANWYREKYPGISPAHLLKKSENFWYMSPKFRVAVFKEDSSYFLKDLRYYSQMPFKDFFYADENQYLNRKVPAIIDNLMLANQINLGSVKKLEILEKFDRLILILDNREVQISTSSITTNGQDIVKPSAQENNLNKKKLTLLTFYNKAVSPVKSVLKIIKYSRIDSMPVFGLSIPGSKLLGFKSYTPGIFSFEFQSFSKFLSPFDLFEGWQPWIN